MLRIGLTGGIGSGKTTVAQIFEVLGIPVYYADMEAKRLMNTNTVLKNEILQNFGEEAYKAGKLNSTYISSIVFNDQSKLDLLNSLVHPATMKDGEDWFNQQTTPYAIHEAALIFEAGINKKMDRVIGVFTPITIRIKRILERDQLSEKEIQHRIDRQMDEEKKMKLCDFVISNDEQRLLIPQVLELHEKLLTLSNQQQNG